MADVLHKEGSMAPGGLGWPGGVGGGVGGGGAHGQPRSWAPAGSRGSLMAGPVERVLGTHCASRASRAALHVLDATELALQGGERRPGEARPSPAGSAT